MAIPWDAVAWWGFVATLLAASLLALLRVWKLTAIGPATPFGRLFLRNPRSPATELLGFVLLFTLGSTLVPALVFFLMNRWNNLSWQMGALLGGARGCIGVLLIPFIGTISAGVRNGHFPAHGWLDLRWGWTMLVMGAHVAYGMLVRAILAAF